MKYILPFILLLTVFCFTSCVDTEEKIEIFANNSGVYSLSMDMGKALAMVGQMGAGKSDDGKPKMKKDTLIYFKDALATSDKFTDQEKELFSKGFCKVKVDEANAEMKITLSCPFANISKLTEVKEKLASVMSKLQLMDKMSGKEKSPLDNTEEEMTGSENVGKSLNPGSQYYKFTAAPGKISYLITDKAALKNSLAGDSSLQMMQQMAAMTGEMTYKTIVILPNPVKKLKGGIGVLSDDKKTITYKATLTDLMEKPEEVEYDIEY